MKILIVEDNHDHATLLKVFIKQIDPRWIVDRVDRIADALNKYHIARGACPFTRAHCADIPKSAPFDLIFLDLNLIDSHARQTIESMRNIMAETPTIIISCVDDKEILSELARTIAVDYLDKLAFTKRDFQDILKATINDARERFDALKSRSAQLAKLTRIASELQKKP